MAGRQDEQHTMIVHISTPTLPAAAVLCSSGAAVLPGHGQPHGEQAREDGHQADENIILISCLSRTEMCKVVTVMMFEMVFDFGTVRSSSL